MARVRPAAYAALLLVLLIAATATAAIPPAQDGPLAVVGWPPSTGLVVAEVVTGGVSASDEYVELANAGSSPADLSGLEVAYATSSGATVTKKAAWTASLTLAPGQHLLLANAGGVYASVADAVYSSGLAATGGAIVLRATGGAVVDAVGWGDAANAFVEGSTAPAPAAGQSIERAPGAGSNTTDTNSNGTDFVVNAAPVAQNLAAAPLPSPSVSPTPTPTPTDSAEPSGTTSPTIDPSPTIEPSTSPSATADPVPSDTPSPEPTATPSPSPTDSPAPTATPSPSPTSSPVPTASPSPSPTPSPLPTATPSATPSATPEPTPAPPLAIAAARALPDGSSATVEGVLTTALGALESARTGFVQDLSGGIALYLDAAYGSPIPAGAWVHVTGTTASRYGERTLRVAAADVVVVAMAGLPTPLDVATGSAGEVLEGVRLRVSGLVSEAPTSLADGLGVTIDDGSGPLRIVVAPDALNGASAATGMVVTAVGPLGQRQSSSTDPGGYRLFATLPGEFVAQPAVTPSPSASPSPTVSPEPSASPTSSADPTASPTATAGAVTIREARGATVGSSVRVRGVVTAEAGRLGTPSLFAIGDASGGLPVKLADGMTGPARGTVVEALGAIAAPNGQTELRLAPDGLAIIGTDDLPTAQVIATGSVGEAVEGRLAAVAGTISTSATKSTSGDIVLVITGADGASLRVYADASAGISPASLKKGVAATLTGIVGQRASRKGALDGYRLWLRDSADVLRTALPSASPVPSPTPSTGNAPSTESIATARVRDGATVTVQGVVTADRSLLDRSGRLTVIEDGTAAIELYLAAPDASVRLGVRVRVTGVIGKAWGAPRLRAQELSLVGSATPTVLDLHVAPGPATEWRLVRITGTVTSVHRSGNRWVAELDANGGPIPIVALEGAAIPASVIAAGRRATIIGIVKRPYPTASDRRYSVLPRRAADISMGAVAASQGPVGSPSGGVAGSGRPDQAASGAPAGSAAPAADLSALAGRIGQRIRVSGVVTEATGDGFQLDDGTATARIALEGEAADLASVIGAGDALDATGTVADRDGAVVVVSDPADIVLVGDLGGQPEATESETAAGAIVIGGTTPTLGVEAGGATETATTGLGIILAALALIAAVAALGARRVRDRRRLRTRVHLRLASLASAAAAPWSSRTEAPVTAPAGSPGGAEG